MFRMRSLVCLATFAALFWGPLGASWSARAQGFGGPVVHIEQGRLRGVRQDGVLSFRGIPYAAPPVGDRRWRAPAPARSWSGIRRADRLGAACIQPPGMSAANGGDPGPIAEDCLYLNVWTPRAERRARLPVVVWIHGGAYVFGSGGVRGYSGAPYAREDAVFVSLNYRLGALGFFAHPALNGEPGAAANFGLLDQIAALQWVQRNIAAFGGDPNNVTIMGQSAGAKSVLALYASPMARGLFHRGVAMSAYVLPDANRERASEVAVAVANAVGLNGADATMAQLRAVPAQRFGVLEGRETSLGPVPIVGDLVLPHSIAETFAAGEEAALPLIMGSASDDANVISAFGMEPRAIVDRLGAAGLGLLVLYPNMSREERARQVVNDVVFTMNPRWAGDRHAERAPMWRYYFDYVAEPDRGAFANGAPHGYEVAFFLNTLDYAGGDRTRYTDADRAVARALSGDLLAFARTGFAPADWISHDRDRDQTLVIDAEGIASRDELYRRRLNTFIGVTSIIDRALR